MTHVGAKSSNLSLRVCWTADEKVRGYEAEPGYTTVYRQGLDEVTC